MVLGGAPRREGNNGVGGEPQECLDTSNSMTDDAVAYRLWRRNSLAQRRFEWKESGETREEEWGI
jgi:hypothetical protein